MMVNNPNLDLVNINVYTKLAQVMSICSQDIKHTLRVQSHIEIRLPNRTTLFKVPPPSVSGD